MIKSQSTSPYCSLKESEILNRTGTAYRQCHHIDSLVIVRFRDLSNLSNMQIPASISLVEKKKSTWLLVPIPILVQL